jgi:hypothetical protein
VAVQLVKGTVSLQVKAEQLAGNSPLFSAENVLRLGTQGPTVYSREG